MDRPIKSDDDEVMGSREVNQRSPLSHPPPLSCAGAKTFFFATKIQNKSGFRNACGND